jgi:hypothetical protein
MLKPLFRKFLASVLLLSPFASAYACEEFAFSMKNSMIQATLRQRCLESGSAGSPRTQPSRVVVFSSPQDPQGTRTEVSNIEGALEFPSVTFEELEEAWERRRSFAAQNAERYAFDGRDRTLIAVQLGPLMKEAVETTDENIKKQRLKSIRRIWVWNSVL